MMEGISHEACSLAGTLGLGKLIAFYDDNGISIDGHVSGWFTDDTPKRFEAYGWHVVAERRRTRQRRDRSRDPRGQGVRRQAHADLLQDRHRERLAQQGGHSRCARRAARRAGDRGDASRHRDGTTRRSRFRRTCTSCGMRAARARLLELSWNRTLFRVRALVSAARRASSSDACEASCRQISRSVRTRLTTGRDAKAATIATRKASQEVDRGSCADPAGADRRFGRSGRLESHAVVRLARGRRAASGGNYLYYGVREFGMAAIMNGLALHGGFIPYGGTFLTFSDYCRNALRMAALMRVRSMFVFTHDSIGLGEDGPTHQPIEHLADAATDSQHGRLASVRHGGVGRCLGGRDRAYRRSDEPGLQPPESAVPDAKPSATEQDIRRGGYVLVEPEQRATRRHHRDGFRGRRSPSRRRRRWRATTFRCASCRCHRRLCSIVRTQSYRDRVLPPELPCVAVEAGVPDLWRKYVGRSGAVIGIDRFGESAPAGDLFRHFGFRARACRRGGDGGTRAHSCVGHRNQTKPASLDDDVKPARYRLQQASRQQAIGSRSTQSTAGLRREATFFCCSRSRACCRSATCCR